MATTKTQYMRCGILLFLCYGATLIQLQLIHNQQQQPQRRRRRPNMMHRTTKPNHHSPPTPPPQNEMNLQNDTQQHHLYYCRQSNGQTVRLPRVPDFVIGGTQKGGTTALMHLIQFHPLIVGSKTFEAHFFDYDQGIRDILKSTQQQQQQPYISRTTLCDLRASYAYQHFPVQRLKRRPELLSFEKTPSYILDESIPQRMKQITPWAKVIFSLRNPIDRAFSHYRMLHTRNQINTSNKSDFEDIIALDMKVLRIRNFTVASNEPFPQVQTVKLQRLHQMWKVKNSLYRGMYSDQLKPWLKYFTVGKDIMVIRFERMLEDPHAVLDEILDFLKVPRHSYDPKLLNESYSPVVATEKHLLKNTTRDYLLRFYEPYNNELAEMLGEQWRGVWQHTHY